jgi:hypothetical protein
VGRIYSMLQGRPGYIIGYDSDVHHSVPQSRGEYLLAGD